MTRQNAFDTHPRYNEGAYRRLKMTLAGKHTQVRSKRLTYLAFGASAAVAVPRVYEFEAWRDRADQVSRTFLF